MTKIVTTPFVAVAANTKLNLEGLRQFVEHEGLTKVAETEGTPLNKILNVASGADTRYTHGEILPEFGGRFCYRSWARGRETEEYNQNILEDKHGSVIAHPDVSLIVTGVSRALTHELVRHGVGCVYSQESQRYVDATSSKFVIPPLMLFILDNDLDCGEVAEWLDDNTTAVESYSKWQEFYNMGLEDALRSGKLAIDPDIAERDIPDEEKVAKQLTRIKKRANESARAQLPNDIETKLLWTVNPRALRHFVEVRGDNPADLEMRRFAAQVAKIGKVEFPTLFSDVEIVPGDFGVERVTVKYHKV